MLVFTRKEGEKIRIGDGIAITINRVHGDKVLIGIEAPINVPVHRGEVYESIQKFEINTRKIKND